MKNTDKRFIRAEAAFEDALIRLCQNKQACELSVSELVDAAGYSRSAFMLTTKIWRISFSP